jgi:flagellar basal body rod protein FlgG
MDRGLYIAASGMLAEQVRQDQIANDLANSATAGYKADRTTQTSFGALLLANSVTGAVVGSQPTAVEVDARYGRAARLRDRRRGLLRRADRPGRPLHP